MWFKRSDPSFHFSLTAKVGTYYDETYRVYKLGWSKEHLHHGLWDENTKSHKESLVNTIDYLTKTLDIVNDDKILDAGCGVGGAARYIVNNFGCEVVGIVNSKVLFNAAKKSIPSVKDPSKLKFHLMDYENTKFESGSFTKIYAIESVCYAKNKADFGKEAFRLLKSGGKLLILDGYLLKDNRTSEEDKHYRDWCDGWVVDDLESPDRFKKILEDLGFTNIAYMDYTDKVKKSLAYMNRNAKYSKIVYYILSKLRLIKRSVYLSAKSAYLGKIMVDEGTVGYGFLYAEKP